MKNIYRTIVIAAIIIGGYSVYRLYIQKTPCSAPIEYKIGTLDPRFGVSQAQFEKDINQANNIWGNSIGKQLFKYNPNGVLTVNLIYDNRQATTQEENKLNSNILQTSQVADSVKREYTSLENSYQTAYKDYETEVAQFNQAQASYNSEVEYWNSQGGAPSDEYSKLQDEKNALLTQQNSLEAKRQKVNNLAGQINALIDKYNLLIGHINLNVDTINNDGLTGTQFEEGVYISDASGQRINIYQFNNQTYFIRVLAHELGHALGLGHDTNINSIMNPINQSQSLVLSSQDLQELKTECGLKY